MRGKKALSVEAASSGTRSRSAARRERAFGSPRATFASWSQAAAWMLRLEGLRLAA
jgi:hypothetical protein